MTNDSSRRTRRTKAVLAYVAAAALWIVASDLLLEAVGVEHAAVNIAKGFLFVTVTGALLWRAVGRHEDEVEHSVRKARDEFRDVIDQSAALMYVADADGRFLLINRAVGVLLGTDPRDAAGRQRSELMPVEAADEHHRNDLAVMSAGRATVVEEHLDIDSAQRIYRSTKFPIRDGEGRTYAIGGVSIDITEEVEIQERLAASELAYRMVFEGSPVPLWFFDAETLEVFLTNAAADSCYGVGALVGRSVTDVVLPDDRERFRDAILAAPDWRITGQWLHRGRDGRLFEVELDSVPVPYEGRAAVLVVAHDVQGLVLSQARDALIRDLGEMRSANDPAAFLQVLLDRLLTLTRSSGASLETVSEGHISVGATHPSGHTLALQIDERGGFVGRLTLSGKADSYDYDDRNAVHAVLAEAARVHERELLTADLARASRERIAALEGVTRAVGAMIEARDVYTAGHQQRVGDISAEVGRRLGLDDDRIEGLRIAGYLHDVGKIAVPTEILTRTGGLSDPERALVEQHSRQGHDVLVPVPFGWPIAQVALQHHERLDGSGYPQGLRGDEILLEARIVAVADVFDAITSGRPYRGPQPRTEAFAVLRDGAGVVFDADVVGALIELIGDEA